jgi:hypothetical protein
VQQSDGDESEHYLAYSRREANEEEGRELLIHDESEGLHYSMVPWGAKGGMKAWRELV